MHYSSETHLHRQKKCRTAPSLGQYMLELSCENATVGTNGLSFFQSASKVTGEDMREIKFRR